MEHLTKLSILFWLIAIILISPGYSNASYYARTYKTIYQNQPGTSTITSFNSVIGLPDGKQIIAGSYYTFDSKDKSIILKLNQNGYVEWQRAYSFTSAGTDGGWNEYIISIRRVNNGYIACGVRSNMSGLSGNIDTFIMRIDDNGNLIWKKIYYGAGEDNWEIPISLKKATDGNFILGLKKEGGFMGYLRTMILKIDINGNVIWTKTLSINFLDDLKTTPDGGCIILASNNDYEVNRAIVAKLDGSGNIDWLYQYQHQHIVPKNIKIVSDGYIVGGWYSDWGSGYDHSCVFLLKIDNYGNMVWHKRYRNIVNTDQGVSDIGDNGITVTEDNNIAISAWYNIDNLNHDLDLVVAKIDSQDGHIIWQRCYGTSSDRITDPDIYQLSDGDLLVTGTYEDPSREEPFVLRINSDGYLPNPNPDCQTAGFVPNPNTIRNRKALQEYPFPLEVYPYSYSSYNMYLTYRNDSTLTDHPITINVDTICYTTSIYWNLNIDTPIHGKIISPLNSSDINCGDGGTTCQHVYEDGQSVTLHAMPSDGYFLNSWSEDCEICGNNSACTITMDSDKTCSANFEPIADQPPVIESFTAEPTSGIAPLDVTFTCQAHDPDGGDIESIEWFFGLDDGPDDLTGNNNFTITHTYDTPGIYKAYCRVWDDEGQNSTSDNITVTVDAPNYKLDIGVNPEDGGTVTGNGIFCPADCNETYEEGTSVTLTATPSDGYQFSSWSEDCEGCKDATCTITMNFNKSCTANFEPIPNELPVIDYFIAEPTSGNAPLTVTFTCEAHDPDGVIESWAWDFNGDATVDETSGGDTINHTYADPGTYQATCTVTDNDGESILSGRIEIIVNNPSIIPMTVWSRTYGGSHLDQARAVEQTSDGGYIVAGWSESFGAGGTDILVLKLDSEGQLEWQRTYGGTNNDKAYSIQQTSDGGYIVAGESSSFSTDHTTEMWILKLRSNGDIEWKKRYHQTEDYLHEGAYSARQTSDGGYIVVGWMNSNGATDIIAMKLANDGSIVWQKDIGKTPDGIYSYDPHDDKAYSVEQTSDGGYIIAGKTTTSLTWTPVPWIIKLSPTGEIQWNREFPYHLDENGKKFSIKETSDGGYIYVASLYKSVGHGDELVMKLNSTGGLEWAKTYHGNNWDNAFDINQTNDGGYIVVGRSNSFSGSIATELWLLKLSATGDIQWQKQYGDAHHSAAGFAVKQTNDGGYVVAGMSPENDFWVLKLDTNGSIPDCPLESTTSATSSDSSPSAKSNSLQQWASSVYAENSIATVGSPEISSTEQCYYEPTTQYDLTVSTNPEGAGTITGSGINCPGDCNETYEGGASVTLIATPNEGFIFASWSGDCDECDGTTCTVTMNRDKTCTANFEPIPNEPPEIDSFTAEPTSGDAPLTVTFTCEAHDNDGSVVEYCFDFDGDGENDQCDDSTNTATFTYNFPGTYQATCTVIDDDEESVTSEPQEITVNEAAPSWVDITDTLNITHSARQLYDRIHRCFFIQVTVENPGEEAVSGPMRLVVTDPSIPVKTGVGVGLEPDGYTDDGDPYFIIVPEEESLDAGDVLRNLRINFELQRKRLTYGIRIEQLGQ